MDRRLAPLLILALASCRSKPTPPPVPPTAQIAATLRSDGVMFSLARGTVGTGCTGSAGVTIPRASGPSYDFAAVTRCARTLKTSEPGLAMVTTITVDAANETPYQDVVSLLDAVRSDAGGTLFSDVKLALPSRALPAGSYADDGVALIVTKTKLLVDDAEILSYAGPASAQASGLPAAEKRGGASGFYVEKLGAKLAPACDMQRKIREAKNQDAKRACDLILIADTSIPYRLIVEVLSTASESGFGTFHWMVLQAAKK